MRLILPTFLLAFVPAALLAESATPSLGFTGANAVPSDHGGQDCSTCHNSFGGANSDQRGSLKVEVSDYAANVAQTIRIFVQHPEAASWGFQMTIREVSDETQSAGFFTPSGPTDPVQVQVRCDDGSALGSLPSGTQCTTARQYAEHKVAPRGMGGTVFEFDVNWTPPANEVGKLHVYVSAVAADGNGAPQGDRVYTTVLTLANAGRCSNITNPIVRTTVNGASFQSPLSSNAMISILGTGFLVGGLQRVAGLGDFVNGTYPTELACVSVQVTGPGITDPVLIPVTYVRTDQINAQLPRFSGTGPITLRLILNAGQTNQMTSDISTYTTLQPFAPAFFLLPNSTSIAAQFGGTATVVADPSLIPGARPAKPGDIVTLYGTGFGDTNPPVDSGQLAPGQPTPLVNGVTVTIGSVTLAPADVLYAGLSPGSISGLYQFNVRIPQGTPNGNVPVSISIGGVQTQSPATIPVQQ
ncbi:MAG TPA: choice-of-anchor V domain-containing protein [Bryobacteraceae bacterium]|nr:choice-of-anchor V domain-containing protein [Bryobacteraceae bacterium]